MAMSCLALIAFTAMFFRWMLKQHDHSWGSLEDWGHAYVMPFLAGYLIWLKRAEIAAERVRPFWPGMAPFLLGLMSYLFFIVGVPNHMLQGAAMVLTLLGLALQRHAARQRPAQLGQEVGEHPVRCDEGDLGLRHRHAVVEVVQGRLDGRVQEVRTGKARVTAPWSRHRR